MSSERSGQPAAAVSPRLPAPGTPQHRSLRPADLAALHPDDRALVGADFVTHWNELFEVPGRHPDRWRRAVFPARAPFSTPGWVMYDARLTDNNIADELRRVEYIPARPTT